MFWGVLLHLGYNHYMDTSTGFDTDLRDFFNGIDGDYRYSDVLRVDDSIWSEITNALPDAGVDTVVLDLGDAVRYASHPEIAVRNAWSVAKLRDEISRLRALGIEPLPKLNFSAGHDAWLGTYSRQVSTSTYYEVCTDLISEVAEIFDRPRLFHLGMDEETLVNQRYQQYVVIRQHDLWWHDLKTLAAAVTNAGSRPWMWSDVAWRKPDEFANRMPHDIVQSNWYYGTDFGNSRDGDLVRMEPNNSAIVDTYGWLDSQGFDQVPAGSSIMAVDNLQELVGWCRRHISQDRLLGYLQTSWKTLTARHRAAHLETLRAISAAQAAYDAACDV